ncbi:MAG: acetate/propionate family kinase [Acidobacteria bacterium]|jgi:acetate kinase|nr:MAG: acetate/propionate family kinase [Acidobacteriota bacterium]
MRTFLVLNYGSSSLKYALFEEERELLREKRTTGELKHFESLLRKLSEDHAPHFVLHRVVHGMDHKSPMPINEKTLPILEELARINPLHNFIAYHCIRLSLELFPKSLHFALFDTDFHHTVPEHARLYGLPLELYKRGIKRYGFHGLSYTYLLKRSKEILGKDRPNLIMMHLGAGASTCAVKEGFSVDTSMGFTPLEGLLMLTRPGDTDPGVLLHLLKEGKTPQELEHLLYRGSGLRSLAGVEGFKELLKRKDHISELAFETFIYRLLKYVGAYWFVLECKVDALVFSGGIGENSPEVREALCTRLRPLGVDIDRRANELNEEIISSERSSVKVLVLKTNEEKQMVSILRDYIKKNHESH